MAVLVVNDGWPDKEFEGRRDSTLHAVVANFGKMCAKSEMQIAGEPIYFDIQLPRRMPPDLMRKAAIDAIHKVLVPEHGKVDIVMAMLSTDDKAIYQGLKHLCDVYLDVVTVCVQSSKLKQGNLQYYVNVALKFSAKLGGVNHILDKNSEWLNAINFDFFLQGMHCVTGCICDWPQ